MTAPQAVTSPPMRAGLNNQRFALVGLLMHAIALRRPVVLPPLVDYDPRLDLPESRLVDVFDVFDRTRLEERLASLGVSLVADAEAEPLDPWTLFRRATGHASTQQGRGTLTPEIRFSRVMSALGPAAPVAELGRRIAAELAGRGVAIGCQLRIERDWISHAANLAAKLGPVEDHTVDAVAILRKVAVTFPSCGAVYVTADERILASEIGAVSDRVRRETGIDLVWKSGLAPDLEELPRLVLAQLDFDVAARLPVFVGTTRSTFFNMLGLSRLADGDTDYGHYAYNVLGDRLRRRTDHGGSAVAEIATAGA